MTHTLCCSRHAFLCTASSRPMQPSGGAPSPMTCKILRSSLAGPVPARQAPIASNRKRGLDVQQVAYSMPARSARSSAACVSSAVGGPRMSACSGVAGGLTKLGWQAGGAERAPSSGCSAVAALHAANASASRRCAWHPLSFAAEPSEWFCSETSCQCSPRSRRMVASQSGGQRGGPPGRRRITPPRQCGQIFFGRVACAP